MVDGQLVAELVEKYCTTRGYRYSYGTAGFRDDASRLDTVMFATGIIACLRSIALDGRPVGVMITASHNPASDNGVKIVEPDGSMLVQSWESTATDLANLLSSGSAEAIRQKIGQLASSGSGVRPRLVVGRDSRVSGPRLLQCLLGSASSLFQAQIRDYGLLTTPQLHYPTSRSLSMDRSVEEEDYFVDFSSAWNEITRLHDVEGLPCAGLVVDCANGVGGLKIHSFIPRCRVLSGTTTVINDNCSDAESLNRGCGADFVKTNQRLPTGIKETDGDSRLYCSFDGDADRVVFYYLNEDSKFQLLDGDRISALLAYFIAQLLEQSGLRSVLSMGVVQTAYANGSSTKYLQNQLNVPVTCAKTGVKHLHHEAVSNYDVGIYFEANGHGTVIFSDRFHDTVGSQTQDSLATKTLRLLPQLINQTVGDAISDMLAVLAVLSILKWSPSRWGKEFTDLPNLLNKVIVPDRSKFIATDQERRLTSPAGLQEKIDEAVSRFRSARSFVRASGTEDAVRVYAEAATQEEANELSAVVSRLVLESC
ncbi:hypothetical protein HG536_0H04690 [Torulaspora globosa]|uniref:Phosphoacetylglucosamine mutase n=1 Tax=Torulaspora globosa TaxID=48254 RepID=A0A7G3ZNK7_9SACH|nr:uncharacterized protein HG536_0H04690 [Torulaspora globosa]QLL35093.1 hypothetical protein HG536_0H04690 [Torulaspora globosa]